MREIHKITKNTKTTDQSHTKELGYHDIGKKSNLSTTIYIHESILVKILSRLSAKSLLRFESVCKSRYNLITSPEFISMHHKNSASAYLLMDDENNVDFQWTRISLATINLSLPTTLESQPRIHHRHLGVRGPCNGIVCLYKGLEKIVLWNPATKESKLLPRSRISPLPNLFADVGFGYDSKSDDYKILQTVFDKAIVQFDLYSLGGDYWKTLNPATYVPRPYSIEGYKSLSHRDNIIICWPALRSDEGVIVSFDTRN